MPLPLAGRWRSPRRRQMGKILERAGGSLGVLLNALGTRTGLWAAMAGAGPLTPAELANRTGVAGRWYGSGCGHRRPAAT